MNNNKRPATMSPDISLPKKSKNDGEERRPLPELNRLMFDMGLLSNVAKESGKIINVVQPPIEKLFVHTSFYNRYANEKLHDGNEGESVASSARPQYVCEVADEYVESPFDLPIETYEDRHLNMKWPSIYVADCFWAWCNHNFMHDITAKDLKDFKKLVLDEFSNEFTSLMINEPWKYRVQDPKTSDEGNITKVKSSLSGEHIGKKFRSSSPDHVNEVKACVQWLVENVIDRVEKEEESQPMGFSKDSPLFVVAEESTTANGKEKVCNDYVREAYMPDVADSSVQKSPESMTHEDMICNPPGNGRQLDISSELQSSTEANESEEEELDEVSEALLECQEEFMKLKNVAEQSWLKLKTDFAHQYTEKHLRDADYNLFRVSASLFQEYPKRRPANDDWPILDAAMKRRNKMARRFYGKGYKTAGAYYSKE